MAFCVPKHIALILRKGAESGDIEVKKLYQMTSLERRAVFQKYVDLKTAQSINAGFEKAMTSTQKSAFSKWVNDTFIGKAKEEKKGALDRVTELSEEGLLTPDLERNFLSDLVNKRLGVEIKPEEAKELTMRSLLLEAERSKPADKFGLPPTSYFVERQKMNNYMKSLNPTSNMKIITSLLGRGSLLFNLKSSITNIIGNTVQAIEQSFEKRIANNQYSGKVDKSLIREYLKKSAEIYDAGHFDLSRAEGYQSEPRTLGELLTHSQGKGLVRKVGRFYEDVVFNFLLGKPDTIFARILFVDTANLLATKIAKSEGLTGKELVARANTIFMDAGTPSATSAEGMVVREQAMADAMTGTFQNDTTYSTVSLGVRKLINQASGDLMLGDQIIPFAKTPANVIGMSLDAAGFGFLKGTMGIFKGAISEFKQGNPAPLREVLRNFTSSGLGITAAFLLSALIPPDDFVGAYPTNASEQALLKAKKGGSNMIRIRGKWISLDYFGFLGAPLVGFLYAKKYGKTLPEAMYNYAAGATMQLAQIPGLEEARNLVSGIMALKPDEFETAGEAFKKQGIATLDQIKARTIPGFVTDIAKAMDTVEREVPADDIGGKIKMALPFLRQTVPSRKDVFGEVIKGEPWYVSILFGARVTTVRQTRVIDEMTRLDDAGQLPTLTNPEKTSTRVKDLKTQVGDIKFAEAMAMFRSKYYADTDKLMSSVSYKRMTDEEKKNALDKIKNDDLDKMLFQYHYRKPKK